MIPLITWVTEMCIKEPVVEYYLNMTFTGIPGVHCIPVTEACAEGILNRVPEASPTKPALLFCPHSDIHGTREAHRTFLGE